MVHTWNPITESWKQEDQKFKVILKGAVRMRRGLHDPLYGSKKEGRMEERWEGGKEKRKKEQNIVK